MTWRWRVVGQTADGPLTLTVTTAEKDDELAADEYRNAVRDMGKTPESVDDVILKGRSPR